MNCGLLFHRNADGIKLGIKGRCMNIYMYLYIHVFQVKGKQVYD